MSTIAIVSWLVGAALGTRLRGLALLPVTPVGVVVVAFVAGLKGCSLAATCAWALLHMVALQLGYFGGLAVRSVMAGARSPNQHTRPTIVQG